MLQTRVTVLHVRSGLYYPVHHVTDERFSGTKLDEAVVDYLASEFKKCAAM